MIDEKKLMTDLEYYILHTNADTPEHYAYEKCKELIERQPKIKISDLKGELSELEIQAEKDIGLSDTNADAAHSYGKQIAYHTCIKKMEEMGI